MVRSEIKDFAKYRSLLAGNLTPIEPFSVDYLIVAGGGGAGTLRAGGGAGGYREGAVTLSGYQTYEVTVGAGGNSPLIYPSRGGTGINSNFSTISASGGGGGAGEGPESFTPGPGQNGSPGGSGGGASQYTGTGGAGNIGNYTPAEGFAGGGISGYLQAYAGAGGGGAGAAGGTGTGAGGGNGGIGRTTTIISTTLAAFAAVGQVSSNQVYFAGGGAGANGNQGTDGVGGLGGGANVTLPGSPNTGGGGGGRRVDQFPNANGAGGSGAVILSYPNARTIETLGGLVSNTVLVGPRKITIITAGTGNVRFI
jgi:hypothetical protein